MFDGPCTNGQMGADPPTSSPTVTSRAPDYLCRTYVPNWMLTTCKDIRAFLALKRYSSTSTYTNADPGDLSGSTYTFVPSGTTASLPVVGFNGVQIASSYGALFQPTSQPATVTTLTNTLKTAGLNGTLYWSGMLSDGTYAGTNVMCKSSGGQTTFTDSSTTTTGTVLSSLDKTVAYIGAGTKTSNLLQTHCCGFQNLACLCFL